MLDTDGDVEVVPLRSYTEKAYLDYSMYVINDRALPHVGEGLNRFNGESSTRCLKWDLIIKPNLRSPYERWVR